MWRTADPNDPESQGARAARVVVLVATALFLLVITRGRPWELFDRAGFSADFYDEQARAFLRGRLAVDPAVAGMEGFVVDGRTYLYYGPLLALVRLPFALVGHVFDGRLVRLSMTIGFMVLCTGAYHLVVQARRRFGGVPSSWRTAGFVAAVAASPALALTGWVSVYHETELWAAAFAVWAAVGAARLLVAPDRNAALLTGGAVIAALLTRASVGIGIAVGVGGLMLLMRRGRRVSYEHATIVIGSCILGFGVHVTVNAAKFGSLLGLPADRQVLTLQDPERAAWFAGNNGSFFGLRFAPTTLVHYLRPDTIRFERLLPFVRFGPLATDRGSYPMETITPSASLTAAATLLFLTALMGIVAILRRRDWSWLCLVVGAAVAAVPTFTIAFIGNRYLVDMLPVLIFPAAVAFATVDLPGGTGVRRVARIALVGGVVWGAWVNTALAVWTAELKNPGFTEWRYRIDDLVFGSPAPGLRLVADGPVGRDGEVALAVDGEACTGVYIAEQGRWVPLERANGERRLTGMIAPAAATTTAIATGAGWQIDLVATDSDVRAVVRRGAETIDGTPVAWSGGPVEIEVVADPLVPELSVTVDGALSLYRFDPPADRPQPAGGFVAAGDRGDSLCRLLAARR